MQGCRPQVLCIFPIRFEKLTNITCIGMDCCAQFGEMAGERFLKLNV